MQEILEQLELTKGEAKVYLALVRIGFSSIGKVVDESKVTKSKVYDILNRLKEKGLVSSSVKNGVQFFDAAAPQSLEDFLDRKEERIQKQREMLQKVLPQLISLQAPSVKKERVEIFDGFRGLKNAFQIAKNEFKRDEEFLVLGVEKTLSAQQLRFFIDYQKSRVAARVKTKVIFTSNLRGAKEYHQPQGPYNQERFLEQSSAVPINVYKDIILIPLLEPGEKEITMLIRNQKLAEGLRQYFNTLWVLSKP